MIAAKPDLPSAPDLTARLLAQRGAFKAFLASRVGNEADAEDLLQNGLVKALARADEVKDGEKAVAWFYQILRNAIVDHRRSRNAAARRDDRWAAETGALVEDAEADRQICACFEQLLPTLKPTHAELIRRVELQGEAVAHAAAALGLTPNNASVTLHRARNELRTKLLSFCTDCRCLERCECE
jgi:RNA polymerase sigma-70 factor (ECF subfamily)